MMVTVAPEMTPPVWSVTVPRMRPKLPCENSDTENSNTPSVASSREVTLLVRPRKDVQDPDGIELIVSPPRRFEIGQDPTNGKEQPMGLRLLRQRNEVKEKL